MKKILLLITFLLLLSGCNSERKETKIKERVLAEYSQAYPGEEFYIAYGPDYNKEFSQTNIRYRMLLSSKRLEDLDYHSGFQLNLENENSPIDTRNYQNKLDYLDVYAPLKREAKDIFGENIIFEIDGTYTSGVRRIILNNLGTNLPVEEKTGFSMIIFSTFVDDLDAELENEDKWKEKMYNLGKRYWEHYNVLGALQMYIYDRALLGNYSLVRNSLLTSSLADDDIKLILEKIKNNEVIDEEEEKLLLSKMITVKGFYGNSRILMYMFTDKIKNEHELVYEAVELDKR